MPWDPAQYHRFTDHRLRPAVDLLSRVETESPRVAYDLGAGTGNVTQLLAERWPGARIIGVDSSEEMLRKAAERAPNIEWQVGDIGRWRPAEPAELIYSNAALHWLPGHRDLFTGLARSLAPGGVLAVQMPRNFGAPSHTAIRDAAIGGEWRQTLEPLLRPAPVEPLPFYVELLSGLVSNVDAWETEYIQVLSGDNPVKEWTKGTWLRPLLDALEEPRRSAFESVYAELVAARYPKLPDGTTLFPFKRIFMVATR